MGDSWVSALLTPAHVVTRELEYMQLEQEYGQAQAQNDNMTTKDKRYAQPV